MDNPFLKEVLMFKHRKMLRTDTQVANALGVTVGFLSLILHGHRGVTKKFAKKVAEVFGIDEKKFFIEMYDFHEEKNKK
jgi:plasmid maintenance system antidote protein VapI